MKKLEGMQGDVKDVDLIIQDLDIGEIDFHKAMRVLRWADQLASKAEGAANLEITVMMRKLEDLSKQTDKPLSAKSIHDILRRHGVVD